MLSSEISAKSLHSMLHSQPVTQLSKESLKHGSFTTTAAATANKLCVLFTTMQEPLAPKPSLVLSHPNSYIPSSVLFDFQNVVVDKDSDLSNTMPSLAIFEEEARRLGIDSDSHIVVYDDFGNFCASRVWFMFKAMGHTHISILSGGLEAWLKEGYSTEAELARPSASGNFTVQKSERYQFVGQDFILDKVLEPSSPCMALLDARSELRFIGQSPEPKAWLRSGHIPRSRNLHYKKLQKLNGAYLPIAQIKQVFFDSIGLNGDASNGMAFTCGSGVTACILAQAADSLGYTPLYVYDGSWSDWGKHAELPIATGK